MSARTWSYWRSVIIGGAFLLQPEAQPVVARRRGQQRRKTSPRRSTTRPSSPSPSTTPTSRSCATCATCSCARGVGNLRFMDIAATVNPATVHFRSLTEPSRVSVLEQNYEYDLLEPDKLLRKYVGREVTLVRTRQEDGIHAAGRGEGPAPQLQQRAGVEDRQRDRHRHGRRPHPLSRAARQPLLAAHADLDAGERRRARATASRRRTWPASWRGTPTTC